MKVLLIEEFSGVHNNLYLGLKKLGIKVDLISKGDGWKNIGIQSHKLGYRGEDIVSRSSRLIHPYLNLKTLSGYDYVNVISAHSQRTHIIKLLKRQNKKIGAFSCGSDIYTIKHMLKNEYSPIMGEARNDEFNILNALFRKRDERNASLMDTIIPLSKSYHEGIKHLNNSHNKVLNFPLHIEDFSYEPNTVNNNIKILHGISRSGFKGSDIILQALNLLEQNYGSRVQIEVVEKLPYQEYLSKIKASNILIDQCYSYGFGMNALIAMGLGKVVLSGNYYQEQNPIVNIKPDVKIIYDKLVDVISGDIEHLGEKSRRYVEQNHDSVKIAANFIEIISNI